MCGIIGYFKLKENNPEPNFIEKGFELMKHRGPDNHNFVNYDNIAGLGHLRLSIIDTSSKGNNPIVSGNASIIVNCEIYNYLELKTLLKDVNFVSTSDTEVLLEGIKKFGTSFLNKCNGMFAFAYYDKEKKELLLVRDRFGVKPLYYLKQNDVLYFSSEIKPLIVIKKNLVFNENIVDAFVKDTASDFDKNTFVNGIFSVEAGSLLIINKEGVKEQKWYHGNDFEYDFDVNADYQKTVDFYEDILTDAIKIRHRSDVPICITLSGGLDSSTIYTLAKEKLHSKIQPVTFRHIDSKTDEYYKVKQLADSYHDKPICITNNHSTGMDDLWQSLYHLEYPIWNLSSVAYQSMYKEIRAHGFTVVIEGHGSDEQLGGYPFLVEKGMLEAFCRLNFKFFNEINDYALNVYNENLTNNTPKQRNFFQKIYHALGLFYAQKHKLNLNIMQHALNDSFSYKILPIVLRTFDRLTMAASVESRSPFMDYRLVELTKKLPYYFKVNKIGSKAILREILKKYHKDYIYQDKVKMGFALDMPRFVSEKNNQSELLNLINSYSNQKYQSLKKIAQNNICKKHITWPDTEMISKIAALQIIEEMYTNKNNKYYCKIFN